MKQYAVPLAAAIATAVLSGPTPAAAALYKCVGADGRIEYSSMPCGPDESVDYITGDTFSVTTRSRCPRAKDPKVPLSGREIQRQRRMADEAAGYDNR